MQMERHWDFNVPVGDETQKSTMADLMLLAKKYQDSGEYETARFYYEQAASVNNLTAKFHLACLLRDTPELEMPQSERYSRSERLFRELENTLNKPKDLEAVNQELSILYQYRKMPVSFLGYKLRAYHLSNTPDPQQLSLIERSINKIDLSTLEDDPHGTAVLGIECLREAKLEKNGIYLLREAVKYGDKHGIYALLLGDFLEGNPSVDEDRHTLAAVYKTIAEQRGNPDILRRHS